MCSRKFILCFCCNKQAEDEAEETEEAEEVAEENKTTQERRRFDYLTLNKNT